MPVLFDLSKFQKLYRTKNKATGDAAADVRISLDPVPAKTLRVLTHVTVENETDTCSEIRLGIHNRGEDFFLDEIRTVIAAELCISRSDVLLGDGDSFFARLSDTHDVDVLVMTCVGWEQRL